MMTTQLTADRAPAALPATDASRSLAAVAGQPRRWLRLEGLAAFVGAAAVYLHAGGNPIALVPLLLLVDVSAVGYLAGPRVGALTYNLAHNWAVGLAVLGAGLALGAVPPLVLGGAVLVAHTGMDRLAGYGLKYPSAFGDTHLGRIGR